MENTDNIEKLLVDYFSGSIPEDEAKGVESWKNSSNENGLLFDQYKKVWEIWHRHHLIDQVDTNKAHLKVKGTINKGGLSNRKISIGKVAAVLIPLLIVSGYLLFWQLKSIPSHELTQEVTTSYGVRKKIELADGTTVTLNSGSTLKFPTAFSKNSREVILTGEAYFDVVTNPRKPFYVNIGELSIKVLGTKFNVVAYPEENIFETTLVSGKIELVKRNDKTELKLADVKPHDHLVYIRDQKRALKDNAEQLGSIDKRIAYSMKKTPALLIRKAEVEKHISWVEGKLIFKNDPIKEVTKRLGRWYNVDIILDDNMPTDFSYTATFINETIEQVLELLKLSAPITYKIQERKKSGKNEFERTSIILTLNLE